MTFAEWIVTKRKAQRMSQVECAKAAGVSTPVWCEYENIERKAQPRRDTVRKIALALDVPVDEAMQAAGYDIGTDAEVPPEWARLWTETPVEKRPGLLKATRGVQEVIAVSV
jgi:transcriptional regulator with XRE-family HTH domain